jgi:GNAT superfamily N-acetyltransferase
LNPTVSINAVTPSQYKTFSSSEPALDEYLKRYAKQNEKIDIGRTFVLVKDEKVIGYYTLSKAQIHIEDLPEAHRKKLPRYPVPASKLCKLAVDQSFQGQRIGEHLLMDAIKRVLHVDASIAIHAFIVDAKTPKAKNFYLKYGFMPLTSHELTLFLPLATLKSANQQTA